KWLNEYGTVEAIIANSDKIGGKVGESLRENIEQLVLSQKLATIRQDVELPFRADELVRARPDAERLREIYSRFELRALLRQLDEQATAGAAPANAAQPDDEAVAYETVFTEESLEGWLEKTNRADVTAVNIETTSIEYMAAELVGIALSVKAG